MDQAQAACPYRAILALSSLPVFRKSCSKVNSQPLLDTLLELKAQDWAIDSRVTREGSPEDWERWQEIKAQRRK